MMQLTKTAVLIFAIVAATGIIWALTGISASGCMAFTLCKQKGMYELHEVSTW